MCLGDHTLVPDVLFELMQAKFDIPWDAQFKGSPSFFNKNKFFNNSPYYQKKDHLQTLQTILRKIGPFVSILAQSSARTLTTLQKLLRFEQNCYGLNTQFYIHKANY